MNNESTPTGKNQKSGPEYWMTLEQYDRDPSFAERAETEFMSSPYKTEDGKDGFARRDFLKLMGASIALASTSCIRRPVQKIIPYAQAPKEITPGVPNFYASTWFDGVEGYGTLVKTLEGRPLKIEGNPLHPMNLGGLTARAHAEVLSLYDPDRMHAPTRNLPNKGRTNKESISAKWEDMDAAITTELAKGSVAILSSTLPSPSTQAIIADFSKAYGNVRWIQYDTMQADALREAQKRSYGKAGVPRYRFDKAKFVVSIDADFLGTYLSPAEFMKQWSKGRKPGAEMSRLVSFESLMTLTGMNADDRYRIKPSQQVDVVMGLINEISKKGGSVPAAAAQHLKAFENVGERLGIGNETFQKIAAELLAHRGHGLVIAGGLQTQTQEAVELQMAVNALNSVLGNDGQTIDHDGAALETRKGSSADLASLIKDMNAGKVKTLIIHNLNPGYALPTDAGFQAAVAKVDFVVATSNRNDETGKMANYVIPNGTTLESWGDFELQTGLYSIQQPTIRPLYDSRSFEESLLAWTKSSKNPSARAKAAKDWFDFVQGIWKTEIYPHSAEGKGKSFDEFWNTVLQQGVVSVGDRRERSGASRTAGGTLNLDAHKASTGYELALYSTQQIADGKFANVAWMQELPDPVTKIVWDNHVSISLAAARKEGLKEGDVIVLRVGDKKLTAPVHVQPGMHDDVFALSIGYGRPDPGKVGRDVGVNAFELASFGTDGNQVYSGLPVTFTKTLEKHKLASPQGYHIITPDIAERQLVVDTTNAEFMKNPSSGIHNHKVFSIWPSHQYTKHKWAMSVDLNSCTGCSACVIACQSENNVPVVGKKYVMEGREMHWIRIDRYYKGNPENPEVIKTPTMCQHCENAPCETVCPVLATVHNDEGLNDMIYNRCVGTRYCSNNCPYKVRRFNWFNYSKREEPTQMALNPDVTVRSRGVMEKCTFCVHRIRHATSAGKGAAGSVPDGTIKTACQETCPTNAITFGDLNDKESAVAKLFVDQRAYALLEDLNTAPRVRYLSHVRNAVREAAEVEGKEHPDFPGERREELEMEKAKKEAPHSAHNHSTLQGELV